MLSEVLCQHHPKSRATQRGGAMRRPRSKRMGVERGQRPYKGRSPVLGPRPTRLECAIPLARR